MRFWYIPPAVFVQLFGCPLVAEASVTPAVWQLVVLCHCVFECLSRCWPSCFSLVVASYCTTVSDIAHQVADCYYCCCCLGSRDGTVGRALASHRCGSEWIPGLDAICGLSLLLVFFYAPRGVSLGTLVFPSPQNPTFPNSNSIQISVDK